MMLFAHNEWADTVSFLGFMVTLFGAIAFFCWLASRD